MDTPSLVESNVKVYLDRSLKMSRAVKQKESIRNYNIIFAVIFVLCLGGFLLYKYKGKMTPYEKEEKQAESRHYILSKLRNMAAIKRRETGQSLTGLPTWGESLESSI